MEDDCPPSYEEVLNQSRVVELPPMRLNQPSGIEESRDDIEDEQRSYWLFLRANFTIFDIAVSMSGLLGCILMLLTDSFDVNMVDVTGLCDDDGYSYERAENTVGMSFAYFTLGGCFICIILSSFLGISIGHMDVNKILMKILRKTWIISSGFVFLCIEVQALQLAFGKPSPYFFSDSELYNYYCTEKDVEMTKILRDRDREYRMSFPSLTMAANLYPTAFIIFYLDHFDVGLGPHTAQSTVLLFFGTKCLADGVKLSLDHEHHVIDILVSAVLGILSAAFTVRNLKGTVLRNISALPKYVTNSILYDRLQRTPEAVSTSSVVTHRNMLYNYEFPAANNQDIEAAPET